MDVGLLEKGVTEVSRVRLVKEVREATIASGEMYPGFGIGNGGIDEVIRGQKFDSAGNAATSVNLNGCRNKADPPENKLWLTVAVPSVNESSSSRCAISRNGYCIVTTNASNFELEEVNAMGEMSETRSRCSHLAMMLFSISACGVFRLVGYIMLGKADQISRISVTDVFSYEV